MYGVRSTEYITGYPRKRRCLSSVRGCSRICRLHCGGDSQAIGRITTCCSQPWFTTRRCRVPILVRPEVPGDADDWRSPCIARPGSNRLDTSIQPHRRNLRWPCTCGLLINVACASPSPSLLASLFEPDASCPTTSRVQFSSKFPRFLVSSSSGGLPVSLPQGGSVTVQAL